MFTGLIEAVGEVTGVGPASSGLRIGVRTGLAGELNAGDSVAVNGVCLTVVATEEGCVAFDVGPETARVTTLAALGPGRAVNLERSMSAGGRFGGHFVQGHVDATGTLIRQRTEGEVRWLTVSFDASLAAFLVPKGSIAVDGVSLTVAALEGHAFQVMIIPYTLEHTSLGALREGDAVNLECDIIGKYVARAIQVAAAGGPADASGATSRT